MEQLFASGSQLPRRSKPATNYDVRVWPVAVRPLLTTKQREADGVGCGLPFCPTGGDYRLDASQHTQGTLVLDLIDADTGRLAWRATSKKRVTGKDVTEAKLTRLLRNMTKALPAQ